MWLLAGLNVLPRLQTGNDSTSFMNRGAWDDVLIAGKLLSLAGETRKLSYLLHPKRVLVLKRVTSLPVPGPGVPNISTHKQSSVDLPEKMDEASC